MFFCVLGLFKLLLATVGPVGADSETDCTLDTLLELKRARIERGKVSIRIVTKMIKNYS